MIHHGRLRPDTKKSSTLLPARLVKYIPTPSMKAKYNETTNQSRPLIFLPGRFQLTPGKASLSIGEQLAEAAVQNRERTLLLRLRIRLFRMPMESEDIRYTHSPGR